jgi:hypothetical protein
MTSHQTCEILLLLKCEDRVQKYENKNTELSFTTAGLVKQQSYSALEFNVPSRANKLLRCGDYSVCYETF